MNFSIKIVLTVQAVLQTLRICIDYVFHRISVRSIV